jgi:uncharacterized protein YutE (UPF0331/DUF86 family)
MVDKATLDLLLTNLQRYVSVLRDLSTVPRDAFLGNPDKIGNAKYHFVIAIECAIDIANHVIASENFRFPKDNADSFAVLVERGVIEEGLRVVLPARARFRNRLVHMYFDVDDARVWEFLGTSLPDFDRFARAVAERYRDETG